MACQDDSASREPGRFSIGAPGHDEKLEIMWGNDAEYWNTSERDSSSSFHRVAHCFGVCWMDVKGIAPKLPPGKYRARWRLLGFSSEPFNSRLSVDGGADVDRVIPSNAWPGLATWGFLDVGEVEVPPGPARAVTFQLYKHSDFWTNDVKLDYIQFVRCGD